MTIHAIPDDVIEHEPDDECVCGPAFARAWSNGREVWIAYHHPLIESCLLQHCSC